MSLVFVTIQQHFPATISTQKMAGEKVYFPPQTERSDSVGSRAAWFVQQCWSMMIQLRDRYFALTGRSPGLAVYSAFSASPDDGAAEVSDSFSNFGPSLAENACYQFIYHGRKQDCSVTVCAILRAVGRICRSVSSCYRRAASAILLPTGDTPARLAARVSALRAPGLERKKMLCHVQA